MYPPDSDFARETWLRGPQAVLDEVCGLKAGDEGEARAREAVLAADGVLHQSIMSAHVDWEQVLE